MYHIAPRKASGLFWKFSVLLCIGVLCVSCFLFVDPSDEAPPPSDPEESSDPPSPCDPVSGESIGVLQFEGTMSGEKISVIGELEQLEDENLQKCLQAVTKKEVIALTILDLSRHTNSELAEKAQSLVERFDLVSYVGGEINSEDEERQQYIVEFLLRMESDQAEEILEGVSFETEEAGNQIKEQISNGVFRALIPTDSESGDRYYVQASWSPANEDQVRCLTALFNAELSVQRTLEQEEQRMKELNGQRRVYWYSKDWALSLAESIEKCSSEAAFIDGSSACCTSTQPTVSDFPPEDKAASTAVMDSAGQVPATPKIVSDSPLDGSASNSEKSPVSVIIQESSKSTQAASARVKVFVNSQVVEEKVISLDGSSSPQPVPESQSPEGIPAVTVEPKDSDEDVLKKWDDNGNGRISCKEAQKHGIAPVRRDHPAYPFMRDRNGDGIVCD